MANNSFQSLKSENLESRFLSLFLRFLTQGRQESTCKEGPILKITQTGIHRIHDQRT